VSAQAVYDHRAKRRRSAPNLDEKNQKKKKTKKKIEEGTQGEIGCTSGLPDVPHRVCASRVRSAGPEAAVRANKKI
jgi:hypothetical protein